MKHGKKKKPCPCVALEMDENACDGCDKFKGVKKTEKLVRIVFEYKDEWSNGEWRREIDERKASFLFDSYLKSIGCEPIEPDYIYGL